MSASLKMYQVFNLILLFNFIYANVTDYCMFDYKCEELGEFTMCKTKGNCEPTSATCKPIPADDAFRKFVTDLHNEIRSKVAKGSDETFHNLVSNMKVLHYNMELEKAATCQVNKCNFISDCFANKEYVAGQNLAMDVRNMLDLVIVEKAIMSWYNEIHDYESDLPRIIDFYPSEESLLFTQVIWAKTAYIGCARAVQQRPNKPPQYFLTCNYGPGGNQDGQHVLERGYPCSKCEEDEVCNKNYQMCENTGVQIMFYKGIVVLYLFLLIII